MDAKPQRPVRTIRVYGDENVAPAIGPQKTIHQRNKSSPALSTMAQAGGLKAAAKRTAFGDLSNAANVSRPSKDDTAIPIKASTTLSEKPVPVVAQEKRPTALLRPAQRPLSVSGLKSLLYNVSGSNSQAAVKQPPIDTQPPVQPAVQKANTKKLTTKKSTTVFKDVAANCAEHPNAENELSKTAPLPPVHRELLPPQQPHQAKFCEDSKVDTQLRQDTVSKKQLPLQIDNEPSSVIPSSEEAAPFRSDGIYIDNHGEIQYYVFSEDNRGKEDQAGESVERPAAVTQEAEESLANRVDRYLKEQNEETQASIPVKQTLPPVSEPEIYWDEEDGTYEEEGYVTARSFKSRGENTTSGVTTVLFPKVNQKIKKELAAAKELIEGTRTAEDIDDETWDTSMVAEYGDEIFGYMRDLEASVVSGGRPYKTDDMKQIKMLPNAHYMDNQTEIQWSMRSVLMGWLVQVHHRFGLLPETLFLCVNYIDRFLSCKVVSLGKLQLVGATAIFVAAKYEEINCPSVQEIVYMVDGGYTVDEVLKAERFMLSMLQFELGWPGPMSFLRRISKADDYDLETRTLAKYFLELTIMDERFVGSPPSFLAAGAHCLARMMLKKGNWSPAHTYYSNYTYTQLYNLVLLMVECCEDPRKHHPDIFDKYTDKRYKRASLFAETEMRKGFQVLDININSMGSWPAPSENSQFWLPKT
ncbi:MAG: hypothetical protein Q9225_006222 [Loekoesia sp. 1 TL-2023]